MKIIFSSHAKARMQERGIGKSIVLETIRNPDDIEVDPIKGKTYLKKFGSKTLKVPSTERRNDIIVKSVFFTKK